MRAWECPCGWVNSPSDVSCPLCSGPRLHGTPIGVPPAAQHSPPPEALRPSSVTAPVVAVLIILRTGLNIIGVSAFTFDLITGLAILASMIANVQVARLRNLGRLQ